MRERRRKRNRELDRGRSRRI